MGLAGIIAIIFSIIMLGYILAHFRILSAATGDGLADFVFTVSTPLLLFRTILTADFSSGDPVTLWLVYFTGVVVTWTAAHCGIRRIFGRDRRAGVVAGVTGAFSNLVFLGMPLILSVYGGAGLVLISLIISVHMPLMMAASLILNEWALRKDGIISGEIGFVQTTAKFFSSLLRNPLVIGILAGWLLRLIGWYPPQPAMKVVSILADVSGPLALFAMGMGLKKFGVTGNIFAAGVNASFKLLLMPAVVFAMAWLMGVPPLTAKVAVAAAALPSGVNSYLIATRFGVGQGLSSASMVLATAVSALTLALWMTLTQAVWG
ncbi:AEC family transporter [Pseudochrobactrum sp. HB0163]|uniref:AEC family transporter n=1 Tax=Pseudochrobactrum sp. HB0163 TaxID=3450708 RepID=UPI003F6DC3C4